MLDFGAKNDGLHADRQATFVAVELTVFTAHLAPGAMGWIAGGGIAAFFQVDTARVATKEVLIFKKMKN